MDFRTFEVTFACPACQSFLSITSPMAKGPCPKCGQEILIQFSATIAQNASRNSQDEDLPFDQRRFRPATKAKPGAWKRPENPFRPSK